MSQASADVIVPRVRTRGETLVLGNEADVRELNLGLAAFFGDVKGDCRTRPLMLVFHEIEPAVQHEPNDLFAGNQFSDSLF